MINLSEIFIKNVNEDEMILCNNSDNRNIRYLIPKDKGIDLQHILYSTRETIFVLHFIKKLLKQKIVLNLDNAYYPLVSSIYNYNKNIHIKTLPDNLINYTKIFKIWNVISFKTYDELINSDCELEKDYYHIFFLRNNYKSFVDILNNNIDRQKIIIQIDGKYLYKYLLFRYNKNYKVLKNVYNKELNSTLLELELKEFIKEDIINGVTKTD